MELPELVSGCAPERFLNRCRIAEHADMKMPIECCLIFLEGVAAMRA